MPRGAPTFFPCGVKPSPRELPPSVFPCIYWHALSPAVWHAHCSASQGSSAAFCNKASVATADSVVPRAGLTRDVVCNGRYAGDRPEQLHESWLRFCWCFWLPPLWSRVSETSSSTSLTASVRHPAETCKNPSLCSMSNAFMHQLLSSLTEHLKLGSETLCYTPFFSPYPNLQVLYHDFNTVPGVAVRLCCTFPDCLGKLWKKNN